MFRFFALIGAIGAILLAATQLTAGDAPEGWVKYSPSEFAAIQKTGKSVVVDVHATWCPTCRAQQPILEELRRDPRLSDATFVRVDFDKDKDFLRAHKIPRQSTIVIFRGKNEIARTVAETNRERLRAVVFSAI